MQLSRRLMMSLLGGVAAVSLGFAVFQAKAEMHALEDEVRRQASVIAESQRRPVEVALESGSSPRVGAPCRPVREPGSSGRDGGVR